MVEAAPAELVRPYEDPQDLQQQLWNLRNYMLHWMAQGIHSDDYFVLDLETTGVDFLVDLVLEAGWAVIRNRQVVHCGSIVFDWSRHPFVSWDWVCSRMTALQQRFAEKGRTYHFTPERLQREGIPAELATQQLHAFLSEMLGKHRLTVGANLFQFDRYMLDGFLHRYGRPLSWSNTTIFDVGLMEKAVQQYSAPFPEDSLYSWQTRIAKPPYNVRWSLDNWITPKYRLAIRHGVDNINAHGGAYDSLVIHRTYETFREVAAGRFWL